MPFEFIALIIMHKSIFFYSRSVLPDVLDLYMLEKKKRHDALFYSFYVFFNKLASGIALAASQIALE